MTDEERATSPEGTTRLFADQQLADFMHAYNQRGILPASEVGVEALRAATDERTASRPRGPELESFVT